MVINGYNGFVRNSVDAEFIADRLSALGSNRALLHWMKENTQESVQSYTTENAARRVVGAVIDAQPIE
jgi:glycosyltransferase involved in cell wall biosynthesis